MGLLDDAIREHLELKRRRGADPGEVAREQREALDTAPVEGAAASAGSLVETVSGEPLMDPASSVPGKAVAADAVPEGQVPSTAPDSAGGMAGAGETAELDMRSVLGDDAQHDPPAAVASGNDLGGGDGVDTAGSDETEGDSLEWEVPSEASAEQPGAESEDEDVLEETPDFLRETPEQDRLWFEQRPPRDFDFDK